MFYSSQSESNKEQYQDFLRLVGSLSNLFSQSSTPFLHYRVVEKIFCRAFDAEDLSRSDVSVDAKKGSLGVGLKTFLQGNNRTFQKVAEFNAVQNLYTGLAPKDLITKVSELRNNRLLFAEKVHAVDSSIYHCIIRDSNIFRIFEEKMDAISIENIADIRKNKNVISFNDGIHEYSFLLSKSTLTKRFDTTGSIFEIEVNMLKDPLSELKDCLHQSNIVAPEASRIEQTIFLPLYGKGQTVPTKSGLNQWNASGRKRHQDEVYVRIPKTIHDSFPHFFPSRDTPFYLRFPDDEVVTAKICQDNGKALMSSPNKKLGKLLLRDILNLKIGELVTYEKLQQLGIDSVRIDKISDTMYEINFSKNGSYEDFIAKILQ